MTPFNQLYKTMTRPWVAISYMGLITLSYFYIDPLLANYFHALDLRTNLSALNWVTKIGIGGIYYIGLFLLALFFRYALQKHNAEAKTWFLWWCVVFAGAICFVLKIFFGRARPALFFEDQLYGFYGPQFHAPFWSFPSGHTTTIMSLIFGLWVLFPRYGYAFILAGLSIASTRILLTHHYLSDILMAAYLALLEVGLLLSILKRKAWLEPAYVHAL